MFFVLAATLALGMGLLVADGRARLALWTGWIVSLLMLPAWALVTVGPFVLDLRTVAAVVGLGGLWWSGAMASDRWIWPDLVVALLILIIAVSEHEAGDLGPLRLPEILRQWALPYLVGRFFLGAKDELTMLLPPVCWAVLAISVYGIVEAVIQVNPLNAAFGLQYGFLEGAEGYRWGLKRAQGVFNHPIYFGLGLAMFLPWILEARQKSLSGDGPAWWRLLPWLTFACLFVTGSRGAIVVGGVCAGFPWLPEFGRRQPVLLVSLLAAVGLICSDDEVIRGLSRLAGEEEMTITVRGEEVQYSGTSHRLLLFVVYEESLADMGLFGFGSQLRGVETDGMPGVFASMDCHYLRFALQHGWIAIGLFAILAGTTFIGLVRRACCHASQSRFEAWLCGSMAGVTLMLMTVWFSPDFGSVWLFLAGLAANLSGLDAVKPVITEPAFERNAPRLRPAYAPLPE